jgi:uncharacterized protein (TIGR00369 family)
MASDDASPPDKQQMLENINRILTEAVPHNRELGLRVVGMGTEDATLVLPYSEKRVGNPETGVVHGGAVTTLIDSACGIAVFVKMGRMARLATLDLRIDYLHPATPGKDLLARAECYKLTRSVAFVRALAHHRDVDDPVASAQGTFIIHHPRAARRHPGWAAGVRRHLRAAAAHRGGAHAENHHRGLPALGQAAGHAGQGHHHPVGAARGQPPGAGLAGGPSPPPTPSSCCREGWNQFGMR